MKRRSTFRERHQRMIASLLTIGQTWAHRETGERWFVYMVHRADHQVVLEHRVNGLVDSRRHLSFRDLVAEHSLVLLPEARSSR
jgi:GrpB-like predicted nucleotidyltransferase (UPF0157 family)